MASAIIVGFDGSESARAALVCTLRRTRGHHSIVVAHTPAVSPSMIENPYYYERALERALEHGQGLLDDAKALLPRGVAADMRMPQGPPARTLAELARELDADEIAVGSRAFGRFRGAALGSTSHALLHESDRPVLVVPRRAVERELRLGATPEGQPTPPLVVGYDGSDNATAALDYATRRRDDLGGQLVAVCAYHAPADWLGAPYYQLSLDEEHELARELVRSLEDRPDLEVDTVMAPPVDALTRVGQARDAAEIVVGARGLGRFRAALGSVSHGLLHEADRPVVVVPSAN
jgi:nucleotide-binding universal stress UspA family protein